MKALKTISLIALVAAAFTIGVASCNFVNPNQKDLIGTWKFTSTNIESEDDGETEINISGTDSYKTDGTCTSNYLFSYKTTFSDEESYLDGITLTLTYRFIGSGTFKVSGNSLTETTTDVNISFVSGSSNIPSGYSDVERELINELRKGLENNNYAELKKEIYGTSTSTIVNIDANKMVLSDDEGDISEYYKVN